MSRKNPPINKISLQKYTSQRLPPANSALSTQTVQALTFHIFHDHIHVRIFACKLKWQDFVTDGQDSNQTLQPNISCSKQAHRNKDPVGWICSKTSTVFLSAQLSLREQTHKQHTHSSLSLKQGKSSVADASTSQSNSVPSRIAIYREYLPI